MPRRGWDEVESGRNYRGPGSGGLFDLKDTVVAYSHRQIEKLEVEKRGREYEA